METITFSVTNPVTAADIEAPGLQAPEWPLLVGTYDSLPTCPNNAPNQIDCGSTLSYTWEGVAFNTARPYMNNVYFRQAIEYLTNYEELQTDALSTVAGSASPFAFPCSVYPGYCFSPSTGYTYPYSLLDAANDLLQAGLIAGYGSTPQSGTAAPTCTPSSFATSATPFTSSFNLLDICGWYRSQNPTYFGGANDTTNGQNCAAPTSSWTSAIEAACSFSPNFYYRIDDPLRTAGATELISNAYQIGFVINGQGVTDAESHGVVYDPAAASIITSGKFAGDVNSSDVNGTSAADTWDMYTFGWVLSVYGLIDSFYFFNAALLGTTANFVDYNNAAMNTATAAVFYAPTLAAAAAAVIPVDQAIQTQLPYVTWWYESNLWAVNANGWTGFANVNFNGPDTGAGIYYTALNAYSTASGKGYGGNLNYVIHSIADPSGLNPLYNTNWVWQVDLWSELYDSPLQASPSQVTQLNGLSNWMTTSYKIAPFTGKTPGGKGVSDFQNGQLKTGAPSNKPQKIKDGEAITFFFRDNMTFSDNVPITAADYNFSLFATDLAGQSWTPDLITPFSYELAGPSGLIADQVNTKANSITLYLGSYTVWNLDDVIVPIFPAHLFQYFNLDGVATLSGTIDLTQPLAVATSSGCSWVSAGCFQKGVTSSNIPAWVQYLPNLEVDSGPLNVQTFDPTTGSGIFAANPNYQRTAWLVNASDNAVAAGTKTITVGGSGSNVILGPLREYVYNAGTDTSFPGCTPSCATGTDGWSYIPGSSVTSSSITVYLVVGAKATKEGGVKGAVSCNSAGQCSATLSGIQKLKPGNYEVVFTAGFNFLGLQRTWYQFTGFHISS